MQENETARRLAAAREALAAKRMERARREALKAHPELEPIIDMLGGESPEDVAELAAQMAGRLESTSAEAPAPPPASPPVGAGNVPVFFDEDAAAQDAIARGDVAAYFQIRSGQYGAPPGSHYG